MGLVLVAVEVPLRELVDDRGRGQVLEAAALLHPLPLQELGRQEGGQLALREAAPFLDLDELGDSRQIGAPVERKAVVAVGPAPGDFSLGGEQAAAEAGPQQGNEVVGTNAIQQV